MHICSSSFLNFDDLSVRGRAFDLLSERGLEFCGDLDEVALENWKRVRGSFECGFRGVGKAFCIESGG